MKRYRKRRNKLATITAVQAWLDGYDRRWLDVAPLPLTSFGRGGRRKRKARARRERGWIFPF